LAGRGLGRTRDCAHSNGGLTPAPASHPKAAPASQRVDLDPVLGRDVSRHPQGMRSDGRRRVILRTCRSADRPLLSSRGRRCPVKRRSDPLLRAPFPALFFDQLQSMVNELLPTAFVQGNVDHQELGRGHFAAAVRSTAQTSFNKAMVGSIVSRSLWPIGESTWMRFISSKSSMPSIATTAPRAWLSVKIEESSSTPLKLRLQLQSISSPL